MNYIPDSELLQMNIIESNDKSKVSPRLRDKIIINNRKVYSFILQCLNNGNYEESYTLLTEIKNIIKCVWKTLCSESKYPNIVYLNDVNNTKLALVCNSNYLRIPDVTMTFDQRTRIINQNDFINILYSLIPVFDYDYSKINFDKYLFIFKNILLSININYRARLKDDKELQMKEASTEQERQEILSDYEKQIINLKNETVFKTVNYLNYQFYNCPDKINMVYRIVLCRLDNKDFNELSPKNKQLYENKIKNFDKSNCDELYKLYIMIAIYRYQFISESIFDYLKDYIDIMITAITGHTITYDNYIDMLYKDIPNNIDIILLLQDSETVYQRILSENFEIYSYKLRSYYCILLEYFSTHKNEIESRYQHLNNCHEITALFNKITASNYEDIEKKILKYKPETVIETFVKYNLNSAGIFMRYAIDILMSNYDYDMFNEKIFEHMKQNTEQCELLGILLVCLNDERYFFISSKRLITLEYSKNYLQDMSDEMREFIKNKVNEYLPNVETGFHRFTLNEYLTELSN